MTDIDRVAEAIWLAEPHISGVTTRPWTDTYPADHTKDGYRRMAQVAIGAMVPRRSVLWQRGRNVWSSAVVEKVVKPVAGLVKKVKENGDG